MQRVSDYVDTAFLQQTAPRPLPMGLMLDIFGERAFERPLSALLHPLVVGGMVALLLLLFFGANQTLIWLAVAVIVLRLALSAWQTMRHTSEDAALLRHGLLVRATVLKLRAYRTLAGEIEGALLDCAVPAAARRTYIGSIWLADGNEALRLARQGRLEVICLPTTPGTWRVLDEVRCTVRYDRMGPMAQLPPDV